MYRLHRPLHSLCCAIGIWGLFLAVLLLPTMFSPILPVFYRWQNQPLPSGTPLRVRCLLDGTYYQATIQLLSNEVQLLQNPLTDL